MRRPQAIHHGNVALDYIFIIIIKNDCHRLGRPLKHAFTVFPIQKSNFRSTDRGE